MMNPFEWIKAAAYGALGALVMLFYYEGLPGFARIPYLTSIPVIGELTAGAKHVFADAQTKAATDKLVTEARRAAAEATTLKARREYEQSLRAAEEANAQAEAMRLKGHETNERYNQAVADDTVDPDGAVVTLDDLEWLRNHK